MVLSPRNLKEYQFFQPNSDLIISYHQGHIKSYEMSETTKEATWVHYSAPRFGIEDILLPEGHGIVGASDDLISGGYNGTPGRFEIKLLHSSAQVSRQLAALEEVANYQEDVIDSLVHADFQVAVADETSFACSVCFDDRGEYSETEHRVLLKSPFGHGLYISFIIPSSKLDFAKDFSKKMLKPLKWTDRSLVFSDAASRFVGSWRYKSPIPAGENYKPGYQTVSAEDLNFDEGGDYSYTKVLTHTAENGEEETEIAGFGVGRFEAYGDSSELLYLLIMDEQTGADECKSVQLKDDKMIKDGNEWARVVESEV